MITEDHAVDDHQGTIQTTDTQITVKLIKATTMTESLRQSIVVKVTDGITMEVNGNTRTMQLRLDGIMARNCHAETLDETSMMDDGKITTMGEILMID